MLRPNERGSMRSQQWKATTMNNNIEVMKSVWRRVERPSAVKLRRIKAKAELEARVTLRYMALLAAVMTMLMMAFAPMVHGQDVGLAVFNYTDASGKKQSVDVVDKYYPKKIVQPIAKADAQIDPKLRRAATIAEERARAHSLSQCWHFVKEALVAAGVVKSRPQTTLAKQAGQELVNNYGFKKLPVSNPYEAPVGSVLVYGAKSAAGHVEIRTETGFVSDFRSKTPSPPSADWRFREELAVAVRAIAPTRAESISLVKSLVAREPLQLAQPIRIAVWSGPRNISTAMMRTLAIFKQSGPRNALNRSGFFMLDRSLALGLRNQTVGCLG